MTALATFIGSALIGWMIADFLSGVVHWWLDRVGTVTMPVIGRSVVEPNRLHHDAPLVFVQDSVLKRNLAMWLLVGAVSLLWLAVLGPSVVWLFATLGAALTNEVHVQTHVPLKSPVWVMVMQEIGIIQSPRHHAGHHRPPSDRNYCSLTDWLNPILNRVGLWSGLERTLTVVGLAPNQGVSAR